MVVGVAPILYHEQFGLHIDERGHLGDTDYRVKKSRGCQGRGSIYCFLFVYSLSSFLVLIVSSLEQLKV